MKNQIVITLGAIFSLTLLALVGNAIAGDCQCQDCRPPAICKMVEVKTPIKKIVYECKEVPYCLPKPHHGCCCPECEACVRYKKVLIKKEIVVGEKCEYKCVPEILPCGNGGPCNCQYGQGPCADGQQNMVPAVPQPAPSPAVGPPMPPAPVVDPSARRNSSPSRVPAVVVAAPVSSVR